MPKDRLPQAFGLKNDEVPEGFWAQLVYPFRRVTERAPARV
jgi:hypothetical protein